MPGGACCWTGVCCDPPRQGLALAAHLNIPSEAAQAVAGISKDTGHVLVPRALPPVVFSPGNEERAAAFAEAAGQRLEKLHRTVKAEMRAILLDLGHEVEEEKKGR